MLLLPIKFSMLLLPLALRADPTDLITWPENSAKRPAWGGLDWDNKGQQEDHHEEENESRHSAEESEERQEHIALREELDFRVLEVLGGVGLAFAALIVLIGVSLTVMYQFGADNQTFNFSRLRSLSNPRGQDARLRESEESIEFGMVGDLVGRNGEMVGVHVEEDDGYPEVRVDMDNRGSSGEDHLVGTTSGPSSGWRSLDINLEENENFSKENEKNKKRKEKRAKREKEVRRLREESRHLRGGDTAMNAGGAFA